MGEFARFAANASVVLIGWAVVHFLTKARDLEKSQRDLIAKASDEASTAVDSILTAALEYHRTERALALETQLKMDLQDLGQRLSCMTHIVRDTSALRRCITGVSSLRRSITEHHFEDEHQQPIPHNSVQLSDVANQALSLKRELLGLKYNHFRALGKSRRTL